MKRKLLCATLAAALLIASVTPVFGETGGENAGAASGSALTTKENQAIPIVQPKKLSLEEALKIMTTTGTRAEAAELNKKSNIAVASGYSETVQKINKTMKSLEDADAKVAMMLAMGMPQSSIDTILKDKYGVSSVMELAYNAQLAGVTQNNKKVMELRRTFANDNKESNYQADINQIRQDTINLYNTVLLAEDNYKIAKDNLAAQKKNLKDVNAKKDVGLLSKKDVLQAQSAVTDGDKEVRAAKTQMDYAHMSFNYLLGYNVMQEVTFTDKLTETTQAAIAVEDGLEKALANRNEIRGADFAKGIYDILLKDVSAYPKNSSTYLNAQLNFLTAEKTAKDARAQIEIDIRNRAAGVADKKAALDAAKALQSYAKEGERLVSLTSEEGLSTVEELLTMEVTLYKANLNLAKATAEYNLALIGYGDAQGIGTMRIPL